MFTIENHEKDILQVGYQNKTIQSRYKWNHLNLMHIQSVLGNNHHIPLSHMAKRYIWLEETNEPINEFSIGYMINPTLSINKSFKEKVTKCVNSTFFEITQQHISKILFKKTRVLALLMFYETRKNPNDFFKVLSCVIYEIISNYVCIDYLACE